ncbi:MAG: HAD hydrolase-like protein, partial [Nanoarchaeota archaeon]|nr:HAD hydrolase-like protein [Nanoarchaeota archaeon]
MKAVIFDLDGTIINSDPLLDYTEKEILKKHNFIIDDKNLDTVRGERTSLDFFTNVLLRNPVYGITPLQLVNETRALYSQMAIKELHLFEGAIELLSYSCQKST